MFPFEEGERRMDREINKSRKLKWRQEVQKGSESVFPGGEKVNASTFCNKNRWRCGQLSPPRSWPSSPKGNLWPEDKPGSSPQHPVALLMHCFAEAGAGDLAIRLPYPLSAAAAAR